MIEKVFEELGFFTEQTCKTLQKVMDGKSFYGLQLKYSNNAGNCTLFVQSDNDSAKPEELGTMFMNIALCELGQQSLKKFILETYIKESVGYERRLLFFMERNQYTAWFSDAKLAAGVLGMRLCCSEPDGYEFVYIDRERFQKYADYLTERGWVVKVVDITDFGR